MERHSGLKYRVDRAKRPLDEEFPSLFKHPEFKKIRKRADWEKVTKYIVFVYDKKSDFFTEHQNDLMARKEAAALESGFRKNGQHWSKVIQEIFAMQDEEVYEAIMRYLKIMNSALWTNIQTTMQELEEFQLLRMKAISRSKDDQDKDIFEAAKKKNELMDACDKRVVAIKAMLLEFFGDNNDVQDAEFSEPITPENAERIFATTQSPFEEIKT